MISGFSLVVQLKDFSRSWVREEWTTELSNTTAEELEPIIECRMYLYLVRMILVARWSLKIAPKIYQFHHFIIKTYIYMNVRRYSSSLIFQKVLADWEPIFWVEYLVVKLSTLKTTKHSLWLQNMKVDYVIRLLAFWGKFYNHQQ